METLLWACGSHLPPAMSRVAPVNFNITYHGKIPAAPAT